MTVESGILKFSENLHKVGRTDKRILYKLVTLPTTIEGTDELADNLVCERGLTHKFNLTLNLILIIKKSLKDGINLCVKESSIASDITDGVTHFGRFDNGSHTTIWQPALYCGITTGNSC